MAGDMVTTVDRQRAWQGPALFSYGFRPFFLGAGIWAAVAMGLWIATVSGAAELPSAFDPVSWHAHEFLFGYLSAVVAGFLLTAVPNWTGRLPIVGWPLVGLFALWVLGRVVVLISARLPPLTVALADLALPLVLGTVIAREIVAGRNWKNLVVLGMLAVFTLGNAVFHWQAADGGVAAQGHGLRIGLAAALMMIALIGGRIVPSFTRNWLAKRGDGRLPVLPMQRFDKASLMALLVALAAWVVAPKALVTAILLALAGVAHLLRLARWAGDRTVAEPLVWVLHAGYVFVPLGALAIAAGTPLPGRIDGTAGQHLWMAGAVGMMTLAVMTRATLGHTGQVLTAGLGTTALYLALTLAILARLAAGVWPGQAQLLHHVSGGAWLAAFGGFTLIFGALLMRPKSVG
jgi:uncharacterized protein involved in response to NO